MNNIIVRINANYDGAAKVAERVAREVMKADAHFEEVFQMFVRRSPMIADNFGLMWNPERIDGSRQILMDGPSARWWLSTRLLLGLSEEEAKLMGECLQYQMAFDETAPRYTIGDYLDRFNID